MRSVLRLVVQLVAVSAVALAGSLSVGAMRWNVPLTLILGLATAVLTVVTYAWVVRRTERRPAVEVAPNWASLGRGTLIGVGMFTAVITIIASLGDYRVIGWGSAAGALALFGFMAAAAATEEVVFRGILFRAVERGIGTWAALTLTGLLFGLMHLFNPNATLWSAIAIAVEAGGMLAAAYAATRTLWLPIGLHFGWNFAEGAIFGTDVSGKTGPDSLLRAVLSGPTAVSGGEFGPEASLVTLLAGMLVTIAFMRLARHRGRVVPLRRADRAATATLAP